MFLSSGGVVVDLDEIEGYLPYSPAEAIPPGQKVKSLSPSANLDFSGRHDIRFQSTTFRFLSTTDNRATLPTELVTGPEDRWILAGG